MTRNGTSGQLRRPNPHQVIPRVERHHRLIEELRARRPRRMSGSEIAQRLGVSVRTIERDIADLQAAGIPIGTHRGPGGGYTIDARSTLPPLQLTPGEAAALVASLVAVGPYVSATARSALDKLIATLTEKPEQ